MTPLYTSFYTDPYAEHAAGLIHSLKVHRLQHDVRRVESAGSWVRNCGKKPGFLLEQMRRHPGRPLVWLDADARVRAYPHLFDTLDCDFACHYRNGAELLSGTLYFSGSPASRRLCEAWHRRQVQFPDEWDQRVLQAVLAAKEPGLTVNHFGAGYVRVFDDPKMGEAVVEHLQASRVLAKACV